MMATGPRPDPRLPRLAALASLVQRHAVAALAANRQKEAALAAEIAALRVESAGTDPTDYTCSGAAARRLRWAAARIARLNAERAMLRAERDGLARAAARAVARDQVLERLQRGTDPSS